MSSPRRTQSLRRAAAHLLLALAIPAAAAYSSDIDRTEQLEAYLHGAPEILGDPQRDALSKIEDEDRRALALTFYLRAAPTVDSRWSWTSERVEEYERSAEHAAALAEIGKIAARFSEENPDHALYANVRVRSLEDQIALWEKEASVGTAAAALRSAAIETLARETYAEKPDDASIRRFREFLKSWRAPRRPSVMAPGLSLHGRGGAFDFQIRDKAGQTVAAPESSTIKPVWEDQGWAEKLKRAVDDASDKFRGPLIDPYEPWHYVYAP